MANLFKWGELIGNMKALPHLSSVYITFAVPITNRDFRH